MDQRLEFLTQKFGFFHILCLQTAGNFGFQLFTASFQFQIIVAEMVLIDHLAESASAHGADGAVFYIENGVGTVCNAVKTAIFTSYMLEKLGYTSVSPRYNRTRTDIIQTFDLETPE